MRLIKIGIILLCFLAFSAMLTLAGNIVARYGELNVTGDLYVKDALFVDSSSNRVGIGTKNPGYSLDVDGKIYSSDDICIEGKCLSSAGSGGGGGTIVGRTSNMYAGDMGGYAEANNKCTSEFSGSHVCTVNEILNTIITYGDTITSLNGWEEGQSGWIMGGPPGYNAVSVNDCDGFTSDDSLYYGRYWLFVFSVTEPSGPGQLPTTTYYNQGKGMLSSCNSDLPIACCG